MLYYCKNISDYSVTFAYARMTAFLGDIQIKNKKYLAGWDNLNAVLSLLRLPSLIWEESHFSVYYRSKV